MRIIYVDLPLGNGFRISWIKAWWWRVLNPVLCPGCPGQLPFEINQVLLFSKISWHLGKAIKLSINRFIYNLNISSKTDGDCKPKPFSFETLSIHSESSLLVVGISRPMHLCTSIRYLNLGVCYLAKSRVRCWFWTRFSAFDKGV